MPLFVNLSGDIEQFDYAADEVRRFDLGTLKSQVARPLPSGPYAYRLRGGRWLTSEDNREIHELTVKDVARLFVKPPTYWAWNPGEPRSSSDGSFSAKYTCGPPDVLLQDLKNADVPPVAGPSTRRGPLAGPADGSARLQRGTMPDVVDARAIKGGSVRVVLGDGETWDVEGKVTWTFVRGQLPSPCRWIHRTKQGVWVLCGDFYLPGRSDFRTAEFRHQVNASTALKILDIAEIDSPASLLDEVAREAEATQKADTDKPESAAGPLSDVPPTSTSARPEEKPGWPKVESLKAQAPPAQGAAEGTVKQVALTADAPPVPPVVEPILDPPSQVLSDQMESLESNASPAQVAADGAVKQVTLAADTPSGPQPLGRVLFKANAIIIDGIRYVVESSLARMCYRKIVEANGEIVLSKKMGASRPDRLFRNHLPAEVLATFETSRGHKGGSRLHCEYCRPKKSTLVH